MYWCHTNHLLTLLSYCCLTVARISVKEGTWYISGALVIAVELYLCVQAQFRPSTQGGVQVCLKLIWDLVINEYVLVIKRNAWTEKIQVTVLYKSSMLLAVGNKKAKVIEWLKRNTHAGCEYGSINYHLYYHKNSFKFQNIFKISAHPLIAIFF